MSQLFKRNHRKLWLSASVLAILGAGAASAQTTVVTSTSGNYDLLSHAGTDQYVELSSGTNAYLIRGNSYDYVNSAIQSALQGKQVDVWFSTQSGPAVTAIPAGGVGVLYTIGNGWQNGIGSTGSGSSDLGWFYFPSSAPVMKVDSGATLTVAGKELTGSSEEFYFYSMFQGNGGEVRFGEGKWTLWGPNSFTNLTLLDNAKIRLGGGYEPWGGCCSGNTTGANTVSGWLAGASSADIEVNTGTLTVNGNGTAHAYTGVVNVNAGATFTVGDTHSGAVFGGTGAKINLTAVSSILTGYGTIVGNVTNNGTIKAGGTSGVNGGLTITGNLTLTNTSVVKTSMTPTGVSGLTVNGNLVAAGELDINIASGTYGNSVYPLLVVNGGTISGSFSTVSTAGSVGDAIVGLKQTSGGFTIVTEKGSSQQVYGHLVYANRTALTNFVGSVYDAMAMTPASGAKVDTWVTPIGEIENVSRGGLGYDQKTYGVSLGALHRFEGHGGVIGGAFSYRRGNMTVKDDTATASSNGYDLAVFGGAEVNQVRFEGSAFYNLFDAKTIRPMGTDGTSQAGQGGFGFGASGQISHEMFGSRVAPYVRGTYARIHLDAASETGSLLYDLKHEAINVNTFVTDLGIRAHLLQPQPDMRFKVDMDVAWRYDLSDPGETVTGGFANFAGGSSVSYWKGDSKNAFRVGVNATGQVTDQIEAYTRIEGTLTSHRRAGELAIGVKYKF